MQFEYVFMSDPVVLDEPEEEIVVIITPSLSCKLSCAAALGFSLIRAAFTDPAIVSSSGPVHAAHTQAAPAQSTETTASAAPAATSAAPAQEAGDAQKVISCVFHFFMLI